MQLLEQLWLTRGQLKHSDHSKRTDSEPYTERLWTKFNHHRKLSSSFEVIYLYITHVSLLRNFDLQDLRLKVQDNKFLDHLHKNLSWRVAQRQRLPIKLICLFEDRKWEFNNTFIIIIYLNMFNSIIMDVVNHINYLT